MKRGKWGKKIRRKTFVLFWRINFGFSVLRAFSCTTKIGKQKETKSETIKRYKTFLSNRMFYQNTSGKLFTKSFLWREKINFNHKIDFKTFDFFYCLREKCCLENNKIEKLFLKWILKIVPCSYSNNVGIMENYIALNFISNFYVQVFGFYWHTEGLFRA